MNHFELEFQGLALSSVAPSAASSQGMQPDTVVAFPGSAKRRRGGAAIDARGLSKRYGSRHVLSDLDLSIAPGEFIAIVGRSGCGKSTLLRLLAGLEATDTGSISLDGAPRASHQADIRIMFQDSRLLPWKRVLDNVALGLEGADVKERAREALSQVGLADRANDWPAVLSGGQRQRVALARALVHTPRLLLLDEPLGALDALTRIEMHGLIERLWQRHGFTALLVTHDVTEAVALADRVILIEEQRIALDERVALRRPRARGVTFDAIEDSVLQRVLGKSDEQPATRLELVAQPAREWRWAV
jgi:sulfonate transport system ATP-binding protein